LGIGGKGGMKGGEGVWRDGKRGGVSGETYGKTSKGLTWIFVQGPPVSSYATAVNI